MRFAAVGGVFGLDAADDRAGVDIRQVQDQFVLGGIEVVHADDFVRILEGSAAKARGLAGRPVEVQREGVRAVAASQERAAAFAVIFDVADMGYRIVAIAALNDTGIVHRGALHRDVVIASATDEVIAVHAAQHVVTGAAQNVAVFAFVVDGVVTVLALDQQAILIQLGKVVAVTGQNLQHARAGFRGRIDMHIFDRVVAFGADQVYEGPQVTAWFFLDGEAGFGQDILGLVARIRRARVFFFRVGDVGRVLFGRCAGVTVVVDEFIDQEGGRANTQE